MKFATATDKRCTAIGARRRRAGGFTLAEVLAAMLFMAIVIPVAVEALNIASLSGEVSTRKADAARVAERILNESMMTMNWNQSGQGGSVIEAGREFRWTLRNQLWSEDPAMQLVTAEVTFSAAGRDYSVRLNTLASPSVSGTPFTGLP